MSQTLATHAGRRIHAARLRKGLTVAQLAARTRDADPEGVGVSASAIYRAEAGGRAGRGGQPRGPQLAVLQKIAAALDMDVPTLLGLPKRAA